MALVSISLFKETLQTCLNQNIVKDAIKICRNCIFSAVEVIAANRSVLTFLGEVIAVVGSCEALGCWSHQKAVTLHPDGNDG